MIHTKIQKRELVDNLYELGLSISYDHVLEISAKLGNKICHWCMMEKAICPPKLRCELFTSAAVDNIIDHNPSSISAHGHPIELASPCFNMQTKTSVDLHKLLSQMILFPKGQQYICLRLTPTLFLLVLSTMNYLCQS